MSKYNIFVLTVNTVPATEFTKEEADGIVDFISDAIHNTFNEKFGEGVWGGQSVLNIRQSGLSHLYFIFPKQDTIDEMKRLIELEILLILGKCLNVVFSNVDYVCSTDGIESAIMKTNTIVDTLFDDVNSVH